MTKENLVKNVKEYCEREFVTTSCSGSNDMKLALTRCYGAVMFVLNLDGFDDELAQWWDDVMLPKFRKCL